MCKPFNWLKSRKAHLLLVILAGLATRLIDIRYNLPYFPVIDEPHLVVRAVNMVATGDANPHWFGHPGSVLLYLLSLIYRSWFFIAGRGRIFMPDPNISKFYGQHWSSFYIIGRLVTVCFGTGALLFSYLLLRKASSHLVAILSTWGSVSTCV